MNPSPRICAEKLLARVAPDTEKRVSGDVLERLKQRMLFHFPFCKFQELFVGKRFDPELFGLPEL